MAVPAVNAVVPGDVAPRPLAFAPARARAGRTGVAAIAAISGLRSVESSPDASRYADALTIAAGYAADARRSAWVDPDPGLLFPPSRSAAAALADLLFDEARSASSRGAAAGGARNVTPPAVAVDPTPRSARGVVDHASTGMFAAAVRAYREVAGLAT